MARSFGTAILLAVMALAVRANGQAPTASPSGKTLFETVRPQMVIQIKKHATGADLVYISMEQDGYNAKLLQSEIEDYGKRIGVEPRGLKLELHEVPAEGRTMSFLRCSFATNGLLDRATHRVNLQPLVQSFAADHGNMTIKGMTVLLDGEIADGNSVQQFKSDYVEVQGIRIAEPVGLEYRILIKTTEPDKIFIPSSREDKVPVTPTPTVKPKVDWTLYLMVTVGALAVGALVYSFLLRTSSRGPKLGPKR